MAQMVAPILLILLFLTTLIAPSAALSADCSPCDESVTAKVHYGCSDDLTAYVEFNGEKLECGAALSTEQAESIPTFYYPDAEDDVLYSLLLMDTTDINPIVGTIPPFLPFPIIHYGAMNIPGDVLREGVKLDKFHFDDTGVRVRPFWSFQPLTPLTDLSKIPPSGIPPPDINTRAFNYEFMLGKQAFEKDDPLTDKNTNWDFIAYHKRTIVGEPIQTTYISSGNCVVEVDDEGDTLGTLKSDCPVPAEIGAFNFPGKVPDHVAIGGGGGPPTNGGNTTTTDGASEGESSAFVNGLVSTALVGLLMCGIIGI